MISPEIVRSRAHQRLGVGLDPEERVRGDDVRAMTVDALGDLVQVEASKKRAVHEDDRRLVGQGGPYILPEHAPHPGHLHTRLLGVTRRDRLN
jgi:hypothetical protein